MKKLFPVIAFGLWALLIVLVTGSVQGAPSEARLQQASTETPTPTTTPVAVPTYWLRTDNSDSPPGDWSTTYIEEPYNGASCDLVLDSGTYNSYISGLRSGTGASLVTDCMTAHVIPPEDAGACQRVVVRFKTNAVRPTPSAYPTTRASHGGIMLSYSANQTPMAFSDDAVDYGVQVMQDWKLCADAISNCESYPARITSQTISPSTWYTLTYDIWNSSSRYIDLYINGTPTPWVSYSGGSLSNPNVLYAGLYTSWYGANTNFALNDGTWVDSVDWMQFDDAVCANGGAPLDLPTLTPTVEPTVTPTTTRTLTPTRTPTVTKTYVPGTTPTSTTNPLWTKTPTPSRTTVPGKTATPTANATATYNAAGTATARPTPNLTATAKVRATLTAVYTPPVGRSCEIDDDNDIVGELAVAHSSKNLYVEGKITDSVRSFLTSAMLGTGDAVRVTIDGNADGANEFSIDDMDVFANSSGRNLWFDAFPVDNAYGALEEGAYWTFEVEIPGADFGNTTLSNGEKLGITFSLYDDDGDGVECVITSQKYMVMLQ